MTDQAQPDRNLGMELVRVTEAAALAAARWVGRGDKIAADQAAVDAMRLMLSTVDMDGIVIIGEGEKDEAPMLYNGERVGTGRPPKVDIAVDPIDGTRLTAQGRPGALAVVAASERGTMFDPKHLVYMRKIAVGPEAKGTIDINDTVENNLKRVAQALGKPISEVTVMVLDRPRHKELIEDIRRAGARIRLIMDGDVAAAITAAMPDTGIDVLMGIGGSPEAVVAAAALKCLDGELQCMLWPRNEEEERLALERGLDLNAVLTIDDLIQSNNVFFALTGITTGELVAGVKYTRQGAITESLEMRSKSGTIRRIRALHRWDKLMRISKVPYREVTSSS